MVVLVVVRSTVVVVWTGSGVTQPRFSLVPVCLYVCVCVFPCCLDARINAIGWHLQRKVYRLGKSKSPTLPQVGVCLTPCEENRREILAVADLLCNNCVGGM